MEKFMEMKKQIIKTSSQKETIDQIIKLLRL